MLADEEQPAQGSEFTGRARAAVEEGIGGDSVSVARYNETIPRNQLMSYPFPPDVRELVRRAMTVGGFQSEDELLRDALGAWQRQQDDMAAIREGIAEMEAGQTRPFEDFAKEFYQARGLTRP
jgi:Arc/MetJ-type ribon-helix-helix transcriptional regulator